MNRKPNSRWIYWGAAFLIAGVLFYFAVRGVNWRQVGRILWAAKLAYVVLALVLSSCSLFLRALRWRVLLQVGAPVSVSTAFWATAAGYLGNSFLPARAGELVRTFLVSARTGLSKAFVLTTALAERLSDAITLVVISSLVLLTLPVRPGWFAHAAKPFAVIGLCAAACIAVLPRIEKTCRTLLERMRLPQAIEGKLLNLEEQILIGLRTFHDPMRLGQFAGLTTLIWCFDATGTIVGMRALGLIISLPVAFLLITGFGLGSALPSTPGYVGIYQFVAASILVPFGFTKSDAIAYSFLTQGLQYVFIGFWGALAISTQPGFHFKQVTEAPGA